MRRSTTGQSSIVLTERDNEMLIFVGLMGLGVTTEHLAAAFFAGADRARRRTKQLVDAGLLESWLVDSRAPRVLTLSARGLAHVVATSPDLAARVRRGKPVQAQALRHASAVIWARMTFASLADTGQLWVESTGHRKMLCCATPASLGVAPSLAAPTPAAQPDILRRAVELRRFVASHEPDMARFGFGRFGLRPDGIAEVGVVGDLNHTIVIALEVDQGTEGLDVIRSKLSRYSEAYAARALDEVWLFADGGSQRLMNLAQEVTSARGGLGCRVVKQDLTRGGTGRNAPPHSVLGKPTPLATCQYGGGVGSGEVPGSEGMDA